MSRSGVRFPVPALHRLTAHFAGNCWSDQRKPDITAISLAARGGRCLPLVSSTLSITVRTDPAADRRRGMSPAQLLGRHAELATLSAVVGGVGHGGRARSSGRARPVDGRLRTKAAGMTAVPTPPPVVSDAGTAPDVPRRSAGANRPTNRAQRLMTTRSKPDTRRAVRTCCATRQIRHR